jgi:hypothetical protein
MALSWSYRRSTMPEPAAILTARRHLSLAEASYRSADGLFHLQEGLALLDEVSAGDDTRAAVLAKNLALNKLCTSVSGLLARDAAVPEPELEHLLKALFAFDDIDIDLPPEARTLKLTIARRLIDRYYEGHSAAAKQQAVEELLRLAGGG